MVLPFTVMTSYVFLHARPSFMVLFACSVVTFGFFIGVFLDGTPVSLVGISFGVASSMITAMHSVVIKKSLDVVHGSALHLSWYTNLLSCFALIPMIIVAGEVPGITALLFGPDYSAPDQMSPLTTFIYGSAITVRRSSHPVQRILHLHSLTGRLRFPHERRQSHVDQGHLPHHAHGLLRRAWRRRLPPRDVALQRHHHPVRLLPSLLIP